MSELDYWEKDGITHIDNEIEKIEQEYGVKLNHPNDKGYIGTFDAETLKEWKKIASCWCADLAAELVALSTMIQFLEE